MNKIIIGIVSSLITVYITWLSYTVYDLAKSTVLIDYKMDRVHEALQMFSEEINNISHNKRVYYIKNKKSDNHPFKDYNSTISEFFEKDITRRTKGIR